jgi:ATP synthase protein I
MTERETPPSLEDIDARLKKARGALDRRAGRGARKPQSGALGVALQVAIELVGTLAVAVGIGWMLDGWLATRPWFLVVFFFLGAAAGGLNVYRRALQLSGGGENNETSGDEPRPGREK